MLVNAFAYIIYFLTVCLDLIAPAWFLPDSMISAVREGMTVVMFFDEVFPMHVIIEMILLLLAFEFAYLFIKLLIGLVALIRGAGKPEI